MKKFSFLQFGSCDISKSKNRLSRKYGSVVSSPDAVCMPSESRIWSGRDDRGLQLKENSQLGQVFQMFMEGDWEERETEDLSEREILKQTWDTLVLLYCPFGLCLKKLSPFRAGKAWLK